MNDRTHGGVGLNGEPDDFAARYDRMVAGRGAWGWAIKTAVLLVGLLVVVAVVRAALPF